MNSTITFTESEEKVGEVLGTDEPPKCKNEETHNFKTGTPPLSFCNCQEWMVLERLSSFEILCVNVYG